MECFLVHLGLQKAIILIQVKLAISFSDKDYSIEDAKGLAPVTCKCDSSLLYDDVLALVGVEFLSSFYLLNQVAHNPIETFCDYWHSITNVYKASNIHTSHPNVRLLVVPYRIRNDWVSTCYMLTHCMARCVVSSYFSWASG